MKTNDYKIIKTQLFEYASKLDYAGSDLELAVHMLDALVCEIDTPETKSRMFRPKTVEAEWVATGNFIKRADETLQSVRDALYSLCALLKEGKLPLLDEDEMLE